MGWRSRHKSRILDAYWDQAERQEIGEQLRFAARAFQNRADTFHLDTEKSTPEVLFSVPDSFGIHVGAFHVSTGAASVHFRAPRMEIGLLDDDTASAQCISIDGFHCTLHRFSFVKERQEPRTALFEPQGAGRPRGPVARVPRPPRPPSVPTPDMEERLRWILTPPIYGLLSDPQLSLPDRPYPFQTFGIWWLYERDCALLADEMGLGKTMQAIIAARLLWRERFINQILVVCPKTLIPTWEAELRKWWVQIDHNVMLAGSDRQFFLRLGTPNVVVKLINYEAVAREAEWLEGQTFSHDLVIIDEAQRIKNPEAKTSRAVRALNATRRWALTGTPLENKVDDVCSIFRFVKPGLMRDISDPRVVSSHIGPFMLRRRTDEVDIDLPEKSEQDSEIELTGTQRRTYDQMESEGVVELNAKGDSITVTHVFSLITKLRQICNFDPISGDSAKLERLLGDLEEVRESGRKALVFSQFVDEEYGLKHLAKELRKADYGILELHGDIKQNQREIIKERFEKQHDIHVLLVSYKVGGEGLNLQAANYVFLFDRWFNPAVEDQAVKRVHRIGQANKVFIRKFYCENTFEERILKILARKRYLFRTVIDEACPEPDSFGLTEEEIFSLFNLSVRPKKKAASTPSKPTVNLDGMDPYQFEELVARVYEGQGYSVARTGGSHDRGIDLLAERRSAGAVERVVIQCKHQQANVGRPVLQQLWGVVNSDQSFTRGDLVTSSGFTSQAIAFAEGKRLSLIDRSLLMQLARQTGVADFSPG